MNFRMNQKVSRWLWQVTGRLKWMTGLQILLQTLLGLSSILFALALRNVVDSAAANARGEFFAGIAVLTGIILFQIAARAVKRYLDERTRAALENTLKLRLFSSLMTREYGYVAARHSGEWLNRLTSDTAVVADNMASIIPDLAEMLVKLIGALLAVTALIPALGYILLPGGVLLMAVSYAFRRKLKQLHKDIQEADGKLRILLSERLSALLVIRSFSQEQQSVQDAAWQMQQHRKARLRRNRFSNICNIGFAAVMNGLYMAGILCCGIGILSGNMTYGSFTAVLQLIGHIQSPFANITGYLPKFYAMLASAERLMEAEELPEQTVDACQDPAQVRKFYQERFHAVSMEQVCFTYLPPEADADAEKRGMPIVLENVTLQIRKGEFVAFTGDSGSGKTTLLKLLMHLYRPDSGCCRLLCTGGETELGEQWLPRLFAYVPQGNCLMHGSIRQIVAFSDRERAGDDRAVRRALEIACAADFVDALPEGLDTLLGERGCGLSEGQLQRIAIARAVFSDNPILVLDESTSALDPATERKLLENLRIMTDKTVLIVTHRPAALECCSRQIVIEKGGVKEINYERK